MKRTVQVKVRSQVNAGGRSMNHSTKVMRLKVRAGVKAGGWSNHSAKVVRLKVRAGVRAGIIVKGWENHSSTIARVAGR